MNRFFSIFASFCLFLMALPATGFAQADKPTTGTLLGDARLIITSDKNDIRLWAHPPRVVVITSDPFIREELTRIRDTIEREIAPPYGKPFFGTWQFIELAPEFGDGYDPLRMNIVRGGPSGRQVYLRLNKDQWQLADIVIAVAHRPEIAILNGLWGMNARYTRAQMRGSQAKCYYASQSRKGKRLGAYVSIVRGPDRTTMRDCLWEEVLHTLGPLTDAIDSPYFTFDNRKGVSDIRRANDIALLRALYESGAKPGDHPNVALAYLAKLAFDNLDIGRSALKDALSD